MPIAGSAGAMKSFTCGARGRYEQLVHRKLFGADASADRARARSGISPRRQSSPATASSALAEASLVPGRRCSSIYLTLQVGQPLSTGPSGSERPLHSGHPTARSASARRLGVLGQAGRREHTRNRRDFWPPISTSRTSRSFGANGDAPRQRPVVSIASGRGVFGGAWSEMPVALSVTHW